MSTNSWHLQTMLRRDHRVRGFSGSTRLGRVAVFLSSDESRMVTSRGAADLLVMVPGHEGMAASATVMTV
jgi:hypothetical protein